jgi:cytochrome oxidase Cu insertion factor (SCO1/SenC/PrrC family)
MTHTARVFLIDTQGLLQTSYSYGTPRQEILIDLQALLKGG